MVIIEFLLWSSAILLVTVLAGAILVGIKKEWNKVDEEQEGKHE